MAFAKINKPIFFLRKLSNYQVFVIPHWDSSEVVHDETFNESSHQKLESIKSNFLVETGVKRRSFKDRVYLKS